MTIRPRWWWWVLLGLGCLLGGAFTVRVLGQEAYARAERDLAARGLVMDRAAWIAAKPVDPVVQRRSQELAEALKHLNMTGDANLWWMQGMHPKAKEVERSLAWHAAQTPQAAQLLRLLDEGPCDLDLRIVRRDDLIDPVRRERIWTDDSYNLLDVRQASNWLALDALQASDPTTPLMRFETWQHSHSHPPNLINSMIGLASATIRDDLLLVLAVQGRLPEPAAQTWIEEPPPYRRDLADVLAGERLGYPPYTLNRLFHYGALAARPGPSLISWGAFPFFALAPGWDERAYAVGMARLECRLRDLPLPTEATLPAGLQGRMSGWAIPNLQKFLGTALQADLEHRLRRLAAVIALQRRRTGQLPTQADLPAALLAAAPDTPALGYEAFPPSGFRLAPAVGAVRPDGLEDRNWPTPGASGTLGSGPPKDPWRWRRWGVEGILDAIPPLPRLPP